MSSYLDASFGLGGKRALVTGAARGIGRSIAEALAGAGAEVCVHYFSSGNAAEDTARGIAADGGTAWTAQADLTDPSQAERLVDALAKKWNGLDILVNNAGDLVQRCSIEGMSNELMDQVWRLNVSSTLYVTRQSIPLLRRGVDPVIINISSIAAHNGGANGATMYASSKGTILTLTRGLAKELAPGIRVNGIAPGVIMTDFHRRHSTEDALETIRKSTPLQRLGEPDDHGAAAVFLCGKGSLFITGETLEINGGLWVD